MNHRQKRHCSLFIWCRSSSLRHLKSLHSRDSRQGIWNSVSRSFAHVFKAGLLSPLCFASYFNQIFFSSLNCCSQTPTLFDSHLRMLTMFQSHSMSRLLPITKPLQDKSFGKPSGSDDSCTASPSSTSRDMNSDDASVQPMKLIRSFSDSAKLTKTTVPSVSTAVTSRGRRPHRRSGIMRRTRSVELVNEIKSRAKSIKLNKKMIEKLFGIVSSSSSSSPSSITTNQKLIVRACVQRRERVQKLAAERGRALNDTREQHRTIRVAMIAAVQDYYARRAATVLQTIARGYLIRKEQPRNKKQEAVAFLPTPFTSPGGHQQHNNNNPLPPLPPRRRFGGL
jgi:hypothetical protein